MTVKENILIEEGSFSPEKCSFCKGKLYEGKTDFVVKIKNEVISINKVPAYVCDNCGESYYKPYISKKIDTSL